MTTGSQNERFLYDVNECPPAARCLVYGVQWALLLFPAVVMIAGIAADGLRLAGPARVAFFQRMLVLSGVATVAQTLVGHRYPAQEGPSTALLLTFVVLAPQGLDAIQGGFLVGGLFLFALGVSGGMGRLARYFTPNVVGVILLLIALTLIPHMVPRLLGVTAERPAGEPAVFAGALLVILLITLLATRVGGFVRTTAIMLGIVAGTVGFWVLGQLDLAAVREAPWLSLPDGLWAGRPMFSPSAVVSSVLAYLAVAVNGLGSMHAVAGVMHDEGVGGRVGRGLAVTGAAGVAASALGVVGTVSFSTSPGVILVTRVASRYPLTVCGLILIAAGLLARLGALLAVVPAAVVAAALCVAMASQIGAAITAITRGGRVIVARDYLVVGLPVLLGTLVAAAPPRFFAGFSPLAGTVVGNGLVLGIVLVLLLEHVLVPSPTPPDSSRR